MPFPPLAGGVLSEHTVFVGVRARYFATALIIVAVVAFGAALYFAFNRIEFGDAACGPAFASASAFCEPHVRPYRLAAIGLALASLMALLIGAWVAVRSARREDPPIG